MSQRGPYARGIARRAEILETALAVLSEVGYRKTSLRAIGRELGIEPAHILHYFSSREVLLQEIIAEWDATGESTEAPADEYLDSWLRTVRRNMTIPGLVHLYTAFAAEASDENHPSREFFQNRFEAVRAKITDDLVARQARGALPESLDVPRAATMLIALSDGLQLQWLIDRSIDMAAELEAAIDRLGA